MPVGCRASGSPRALALNNRFVENYETYRKYVTYLWKNECFITSGMKVSYPAQKKIFIPEVMCFHLFPVQRHFRSKKRDFHTRSDVFPVQGHFGLKNEIFISKVTYFRSKVISGRKKGIFKVISGRKNEIFIPEVTYCRLFSVYCHFSLNN